MQYYKYYKWIRGQVLFEWPLKLKEKEKKMTT